jgi:hypothetical protein
MQAADPYAKVTALALTIRNLEQELADTRKDFTAMLREISPPIEVSPPYTWEAPHAKTDEG